MKPYHREDPVCRSYLLILIFRVPRRGSRVDIMLPARPLECDSIANVPTRRRTTSLRTSSGDLILSGYLGIDDEIVESKTRAAAIVKHFVRTPVLMWPNREIYFRLANKLIHHYNDLSVQFLRKRKFITSKENF